MSFLFIFFSILIHNPQYTKTCFEAGEIQLPQSPAASESSEGDNSDVPELVTPVELPLSGPLG